MSFPYLYVLDPNELHSSVLSDTWKFPLESVESGNMKPFPLASMLCKHAVHAPELEETRFIFYLSLGC